MLLYSLGVAPSLSLNIFAKYDVEENPDSIDIFDILASDVSKSFFAESMRAAIM